MLVAEPKSNEADWFQSPINCVCMQYIVTICVQYLGLHAVYGHHM